MIDTTMTRSEKRQLAFQQFNQKSNWVMDCTFTKLAETCLGFLTLIDDAQQQAGDDGDLEKAQELSHLYDTIEPIYQRLDLRGVINVQHRNQLRLTFKHVLSLTVS